MSQKRKGIAPLAPRTAYVGAKYGAVAVIGILLASFSVFIMFLRSRDEQTSAKPELMNSATSGPAAHHLPSDECDAAVKAWKSADYDTAVSSFELLLDREIRCSFGIEIAVRQARMYYAALGGSKESSDIASFHQLSRKRPVPAAAWSHLIQAGSEKAGKIRMCLLLSGYVEHSAHADEISSLPSVFIEILEHCVYVAEAPFDPSSRVMEAGVALITARLQETSILRPGERNNMSLLEALTKSGYQTNEIDDKILLNAVSSIPLLCFAAGLPLHSGPYAPEIEIVLTGARRLLLRQVALRIPDLSRLEVMHTTRERVFITQLATICIDNEYVFAVSRDELSQVLALESYVATSLKKKSSSVLDGSTSILLTILAMYKPLNLASLVAEIVTDLQQFAAFENHGRDDENGEDTATDMVDFAQLLIHEQVDMHAVETMLRDQIVGEASPHSATALEKRTAEISGAVAAMYEENPYPRWRNLLSCVGGTNVCTHLSKTPRYQQQLANVLKTSAMEHHGVLDLAKKLRVLIAGCGTGRHMLQMALAEPESTFVAVDLSASSLSYAKRQMTFMETLFSAEDQTRLHFFQRNLLHLGTLPEENDGDESSSFDKLFDVIEVTGVLHHMSDPEAGLQALTQLMKPGSVIKIALYSRAARKFSGVYAARDMISKAQQEAIGNKHQEPQEDEKAGAEGVGWKMRSEPENIRDGREAVLSVALSCSGNISSCSENEQRVARVVNGDFHSVSDARDLLFHVHEHAFSLDEISDMLRRQSLSFLGFDLNPAALSSLHRWLKGSHRNRFQQTQHSWDADFQLPAKTAAEVFEMWSEIERDEPGVFAGMYQFWAAKA